MERIVKGTCSDRTADGRRKILVVRLDAIGDYVLFRNHLRFLRQSKSFRDAHLTILGNPVWRNLAETFDSECADAWWWLADPGRYFKKGRENLLPAPIWKRRVRTEQDALREALKKGSFDCVISPRVERDSQLDSLLAGIAPELVGAKGPEPLPGDCAYTTLLDVNGGPFMFDRNRSFLAALTGEEPDVRLRLEVPANQRTSNGEKPIVLCIGASHWTRRLPDSHLLELGRQLLAKTNRDLLLAGGKGDTQKALALKHALGNFPRLSVIAGNASLAEFSRVAATAACVVSHDTGPMHIAAAIGVPVVCIANGYSGKDAFWPYPDERVRMCLPPPPLPPLSHFLPLAQLQSAKAIRSIPTDSIVAEILKAMA